MSAQYHLRHPEQARAKWTVANHVRRGKLVKPEKCTKCTKRFNKRFIEGHHWSYKKEHHADVIWLCRWCHRKLHEELGEKWADLDERPDYSPRPLEQPTAAQTASAQAQEIY